jgi:outer membrane receptor for ferrienterochelin and colicins
LSAGVELREYFKQDQTTVKVMPFNPIFDHPQNEFVVGGYAQANVQLLKQLTLDAGGRFDYFERFGSAANPRLALIYQPVETTTLKALYGTAFRAPNAYELYYVGTGYDTSARDLKPEEITTYEGIVEQQITKWLRFSASGFYYEVDRLLAQVVNPGNGLLTIQNLDNAIGYGAEFELEARHHSGALARLSYTEQRTEDSATGQTLVNSPARLVKFSGLVPLYADKIFAGAEVQYSSSVNGQSGARISDYWLVNVNLYARELAPGLEITAGLYNVFDAHYANAGSTEHLQNAIPQDGRNFRVQLTYHF